MYKYLQLSLSLLSIITDDDVIAGIRVLLNGGRRVRFEQQTSAIVITKDGRCRSL